MSDKWNFIAFIVFATIVIIDVIACILAITYSIMFLLGSVLPSLGIIIAAICIAAINLIGILLIPIYLKFRRG